MDEGSLPDEAGLLGLTALSPSYIVRKHADDMNHGVEGDFNKL